MAFNSGLDDIFPGFEFDGTYLRFPISQFPGLSASEAHATRGDWRKLFFTLCVAVQEYVDSSAASDRFDAFAPVEYDSTTDSGYILRQYAFRFTSNVELGDLEVVEEADNSEEPVVETV